jgi:hypothetical protein
MDLAELERRRPYQMLLFWLRDPIGSFVLGGKLGLGAAIRAPAASLAYLRQSQGGMVSKLAISPAIDYERQPSAIRSDRIVYLPLPPRVVARRFVAEMIRASRVAGLASPWAHYDSVNQPQDDRIFLAVLKWMGDMESAQRTRRSPLQERLVFLKNDWNEGLWLSATGIVLGRFIARHLDRRSLPAPPGQPKPDSGAGFRQVIEAGRMNLAEEWSEALVQEGAKRLEELAKSAE